MKKIFCIGAVVFLILTQVPVLATNILQSPTISPDIQTTPQNENIIDIDETPDISITPGKEIIIWENEEATGMYEIASITIQLDITEDTGQEPPIQPLGSFFKFYTVRAKNAFGWTMFRLVAKGMFLAIGGEMKYVYPGSYATVEWWCSWAWSIEDICDWSYVEDTYGEVDAEAEFEYFLGGSVELWAYIRCYVNGYAVGGGGQI